LPHVVVVCKDIPDIVCGPFHDKTVKDDVDGVQGKPDAVEYQEKGFQKGLIPPPQLESRGERQHIEKDVEHVQVDDGTDIESNSSVKYVQHFPGRDVGKDISVEEIEEETKEGVKNQQNGKTDDEHDKFVKYGSSVFSKHLHCFS
jgi:hypothetical protein